MHSRAALLTSHRQTLLLALLAVLMLVFFGRAAVPAGAVGEGTFGLDKPEYVTQEGTAVPVTVIRSGGAVLTQDVVVTVQLSEGTVDEDYPSGTITQTYTFRQGTNEPSKTFMFQTLNKSRYFTRTVRVTILSVTGGGQIAVGASTAPLRIVGIFAPTVTNVSPHSGQGGKTISISGTNFAPTCPGAPINPGDPACTRSIEWYPKTSSLSTFSVVTFTIINPTLLTLIVPPIVADEYDVRVKIETGASAGNPATDESYRSVADRFTVATGAAITNVSPTSGPAAGGTQVTLTGNGGLSCAVAGSILFGGLPLPAVANNCVNVNAVGTLADPNAVNVIRVVSPAHGPGTIDIRAGNSPATAETKFTYTGGPQITSISPAFGPDSGGTVVTITGSGFFGQLTTSSPVQRVLFGGNDAVSPLFQNDSTIVAVAPPGSGVQQITVRTSLGDSTFTSAANFTYTTGPVINSLSPNNGPVTGGTVVTISGSGFAAGASVKFGANASTNVVVDSATVIRAVAPAGVGNVDVSVTVGGNISPNTAADNYSYSGPTITEVTPNAGPPSGGNQVAIKGLNFTSTATVLFGTVSVPQAQVIFVSQNQLTVTVPASLAAAAVDIRVTTISGQSPIVFEDLYTYTSGPIIDSVNPNTGPTTGGTILIITGKNFAAGLTVSIGGVSAPNLNVNSATQVTVLTPSVPSAGIRDVRVVKGADTSPVSNAAKFNYVAAPPIITTLDPNSSTTFGGQEITIVGVGLSGAVCPGAVMFGTVPATSCSVINDTTMKAVTPPNVAGPTIVTVTTPNGTSDIVPNFTYTSPSSSGGGTTPPPPGAGGTVTYSLTFRWTLLTWTGKDGIAIGDALRGFPATAASDVTAKLSAFFRWDAANNVYRAYFVASEGIPGANDFTTLTTGAIYWIATVSAGEVRWTVQQAQ